MIKQFLFSMVFLFCFFIANAQENIVVIGKITKTITGGEIENVHVKVNQRNVLTKSDNAGN